VAYVQEKQRPVRMMTTDHINAQETNLATLLALGLLHRLVLQLDCLFPSLIFPLAKACEVLSAEAGENPYANNIKQQLFADLLPRILVKGDGHFAGPIDTLTIRGAGNTLAVLVARRHGRGECFGNLDLISKLTQAHLRPGPPDPTCSTAATLAARMGEEAGVSPRVAAGLVQARMSAHIV
jgi:hypothetical protein